MPLISSFGKQRQVDLSEPEASLIYKESYSTARAITKKNTVSKNQEEKKRFTFYRSYIENMKKHIE